ncbi:MAG: hypothetical protein N2645_15670 [Clostridia bacterium]|nr:hypothetical protein [Clostridia bacterium]
MNTLVLKKIKLTDKDKRIIMKHANICTDTHGRGCELFINEKKNGLN